MATRIQNTRITPRVCLALALLISSATLFAQSQASTGQIVGTIIDQSGGAIPGAQVTVANKATGYTRTVLTNDNGFYRVVLLPPGVYAVVAENPGFQKGRLEVVVNVGTSRDANFTLLVGGVQQMVEVSASGLETTRSEKGTIVDLTSIESLPINGRRFHDFVQATPTVLVEPQRNQLSFVGQRGIYGNISIDGADYNQPFFGGIRGGERGNNAFTIPQESISEFQVTAQGSSAEFGRTSGGIVNAVTRSGANAIHGSAFYFLRHKAFGLTHGDCPTGGNPKLHGTNAFCQPAIFTQHQWGGSVGGPIRKDKTFYFGAIERQDVTNPRQVLFSSLPGTAPADGVEAFNYFKSLERPYTQTNDAISFLVKVDHDFTSSHRVSSRFNFSDNNAENATTAGASLNPATPNSLSNNGTEKDRTYTTVTQATSSFSATQINEFRFQFSREIRPRLANDPTGPLVSSAAGTYGTVSFLPTTQFDYRVQIADGFTWIKGNHTWKVGSDYNHTYIDQSFGFNQFGTFAFQTSTIATILETMTLGGTTANRFDRDRGVIRYRRQIGNLRAAYAMDEFAAYIQDSWRVTQNFTLNFGVRWEAQWNPTPEADNTTLLSQIKNYRFPIGISFDPQTMPDSYKEVMPRFGFAWSLPGSYRTVIRGNAGIYYARTPALVLAGPMNNYRAIPGDVTLELPLAGTNLPCGSTVYSQLKAIGIDLNTTSLDKLPLLSIDQVQSIGRACGLSVNLFRGAQLLSVASDFTNPRSVQGSLGVETEVAQGFTIGSEFNYVNSVHLLRTHDLNLNQPTVRATDGRRIYGTRPLSDFSQIWIRESSARSLYQGITVRAQIRRSRMNFQGFYTASWNHSDDDNERSATFTEAQDQLRRDGDYSFSRLDRRHQFAGFGTFSLPYGVEIGTSLRFLSSSPIDARAGSDLNSDGDSFTDRPYTAVGASMPRNFFRNRAIYLTNLRMAKQFNLADRGKIQFSVDFFNLLDNDNVQFAGNNTIYGPGINVTTGAPAPIDARFKRLRTITGAYDTVNSPGEPFQMQLGLKLIF